MMRFTVDGRRVLDNGRPVNDARLRTYGGKPRSNDDARRIADAMQSDHDWMAARWRKYHDDVRAAYARAGIA